MPNGPKGPGVAKLTASTARTHRGHLLVGGLPVDGLLVGGLLVGNARPLYLLDQTYIFSIGALRRTIHIT
jgi:hypothetical protein